MLITMRSYAIKHVNLTVIVFSKMSGNCVASEL